MCRIWVIIITFNLGNTPEYCFVGIVPSDSLAGSFDLSPTSFENYNVKEFNMSLNGNSMHGFPLSISKTYPAWPYKKFMESTDCYYNNTRGSQMTLAEFTANFIYAHKFEGESTSTGWLGIDLQLTTAYTKAMSMGEFILLA